MTSFLEFPCTKIVYMYKFYLNNCYIKRREITHINTIWDDNFVTILIFE